MIQTRDPRDYYTILDRIGDGSSGIVYKAKDINTDRIVAIKIMKNKFQNQDECEHLLECKIRKLIPPHGNVILFYGTYYWDKTLYFVMEYMDKGNLHEHLEMRKEQNNEYSLHELKVIAGQMLSALEHIHSHGVFHRDVKPENMLVAELGGHIHVKLADFGLAQEINREGPADYISTRWYRAPEVLLRMKKYTEAIDLWGVACIIAELVNLSPLLPGKNEDDQLRLIRELLGSPPEPSPRFFLRRKSLRPGQEKRLSPGFARTRTKELTSEMVPPSIDRSKPEAAEIQWGDKLPKASHELCHLLSQLLVYDPAKRLTAKEALHHEFFHNYSYPTHAKKISIHNEQRTSSFQDLAALYSTSSSNSLTTLHRKEKELTTIFPNIGKNQSSDNESQSSSSSSPLQIGSKRPQSSLDEHSSYHLEDFEPEQRPIINSSDVPSQTDDTLDTLVPTKKHTQSLASWSRATNYQILPNDNLHTHLPLMDSQHISSPFLLAQHTHSTHPPWDSRPSTATSITDLPGVSSLFPLALDDEDTTQTAKTMIKRGSSLALATTRRRVCSDLEKKRIQHLASLKQYQREVIDDERLLLAAKAQYPPLQLLINKTARRIAIGTEWVTALEHKRIHGRLDIWIQERDALQAQICTLQDQINHIAGQARWHAGHVIGIERALHTLSQISSLTYSSKCT